VTAKKTLNGLVKLQQRNTPEFSFVDIASVTDDLDSASGSFVLEKINWIGRDINVVIDTNLITAGTLSLYLIVK
jgi:hypothetical protein